MSVTHELPATVLAARSVPVRDAVHRSLRSGLLRTANSAERSPSMTSNSYPGDPQHCFLSAKEAIARVGWGRTKGYRMLRTSSFPRAIGGSFRLDTILAYEERVLAGEIDPDAELRALDAAEDDQPAEQPEKPRRAGRPRRGRSAPLDDAA